MTVLLLIPFFVLLAILLYAEHVKNMKLRYLCMTTLVPILILYYVISAWSDLNLFILIGLIFGYLGDIFLMFDKEKLFVYGLGSFLIGHVFYIIGFIAGITNGMAFPIYGIFFILPSLFIVSFVLQRTTEKMGDLKVPTLVYVGVIFIMGLFSIARLAEVQGIGFYLTWLGAQLFMASDGMIAIKKFDSGFKLDEVLIKLTYVLAQFFIAQGIILSI